MSVLLIWGLLVIPPPSALHAGYSAARTSESNAQHLSCNTLFNIKLFPWRAPELKLASHFAYAIYRGSPIGKNLLAAQNFLITE
jgi:hypothetical protein